ncbi:MAG: hypothetical protein ABJX32_12245 [Tateyamaria sp.]|uniref:hypothetical protein n=1 Tax=Tateyamaria sp. TaxID=1929288 RepID=UPI00329FECA0
MGIKYITLSCVAALGLAACGNTAGEQAIIGGAVGAGAASVAGGSIATGLAVGAAGNILACELDIVGC